MDNIARIRVSAEILRKNREEGTTLPPIIIHRNGAETAASRVEILGQDGHVAAELVYRPDAPVGGAVVYVEAKGIRFDG